MAPNGTTFLEILRLTVELRNEEQESWPSPQPCLLLPSCCWLLWSCRSSKPTTPHEPCSRLPLPTARLPDPAPAPHSQTVKLFF